MVALNSPETGQKERCLDLLQATIGPHLEEGGADAELTYRRTEGNAPTIRKGVKIVAVDETGVAYSYEKKLRIMPWRVIVEIELKESDEGV